MHIRLKNIGIIKDSILALDGLTVVTGKNNSGKTTVSKALYALLDAVCNIHQKADGDRRNYILNQVSAVRESLEIFRYIRMRRKSEDIDFFDDYPALNFFYTPDFRRDSYTIDMEKWAHDLFRDLETFDVSLLEKREVRRSLYLRRYPGDNKITEKTYVDAFEKQKKAAISILNQMFVVLEKDKELIDYARESVNQMLQVEFADQIQPVKASDLDSKIELADDESMFFDLCIRDNLVVNDGNPVFWGSPFQKVYLIDDPFVLDDISMEQSLRIFAGHDSARETDTLLNLNRLYSHNEKLKLTLRNREPVSVYEQILLESSLKRVKEQIDKIIPGSFDFSSDEYYVQDGVKLKLSNLATGSKLFSIIKILLERGELDSKTMLILDEPEAHLHPQWKNAFAEVMVMLVKELGVNVLLTTHSSNFMLAVEANMRKYNIADRTNFYQTDVMDDGFVQYHCMNGDMGKIYQDFLQYFSEVKMLRKKYLDATEEWL